MNFIESVIIIIICVAVGLYSLRYSNLTNHNGIMYLIVAIIFLLVAIVVTLSLTGLGI